MWKAHNKLLDDFKKCIKVLINSSVQAKGMDRTKRLSEAKAINSLLIGELYKVLSTDDVRVFIKDFASQIQVIFDIQGKFDVHRDIEKLSIIRYFPLYIRSISFNAFSTKICEWRCLLFGLSIQLKRGKEVSNLRSFNIMDNIMCSLLISLLLSAETPSCTIIKKNASGYLNLLKTVQSSASSPSSSFSPGNIANDSDGGNDRKNLIHYNVTNSADDVQSRLNLFRSYLLYDEASFIDAIRDTKKIEFSQDIPVAISTQGLLKLQIFRVEKVLMNIKRSRVIGKEPEKELLVCMNYNEQQMISNLVVDDIMVISVISSISLYVSQLFRMILGESSATVVHIMSFREIQDSIADLLDRILNAEDFLYWIVMNDVSRSNDINNDHIVDVAEEGNNDKNSDVNTCDNRFVIEDTCSVLLSVIPIWKAFMRRFCKILGIKFSEVVPDSYTSSLLRSANELTSTLFQKCASPGTQCANSHCIVCKTSFHSIGAIQNNIHNATRRLSSLRDDNKKIYQISLFEMTTTSSEQRNAMKTRIERMEKIFCSSASSVE